MKLLKSIRVQLILIILMCYLVPTLLLGEYMGKMYMETKKRPRYYISEVLD